MLDNLFQPMHLLVILFIALLVFGPKKLPELGKGLGEGIRERTEKWGMPRYALSGDRSIAVSSGGDFPGAQAADRGFAPVGAVLAKKGYKQKCEKETR